MAVQKLQSSQNLHVDLAPEEFLGTIKRDDDDDDDDNINNSSNSNNNYNYL